MIQDIIIHITTVAAVHDHIICIAWMCAQFAGTVMSTNYKLLFWVAFDDLLNIASEFYMFFHGIFGTKLCSTSLEDGFFTVVYSVDLLIVLVVYNSVGVFNTAEVVHHAGHVIQSYSVTVVHVCPQCAANKGNITNDSNFFFQQVHIWQVTEYVF